jgi:hypothetical protein
MYHHLGVDIPINEFLEGHIYSNVRGEYLGSQ